MANMLDAKWAVQNGDIDKVKSMCGQSDFNIHSEVGKDGRQLIHCAADFGQYDILQYLIETKKANVNALDRNGLSPLLNAVFEGHTKCVELLISKGASRDIKAPSGETLVEAAEKEDIKKLLQAPQ